MSTATPPFLTLDQRVEYLVRKGYLFGSVSPPAALERMDKINFHYLLGYARNYRMLASMGLVPQDDVLTRVLGVLDRDGEVSVVVFHALRKLEWRLRALLVEHHCKMFPTSACYLNSDHYRILDPEQPPLEALLAKYIRRSREPFLVEHFESGKDIADLPIWAVVDTWSLSGLSRVICESIPVVSPENQDRWLWKQVAGSLGVSATTIIEKLRSMTVLRNLVAHHGRLWMRPSVTPAKIPRFYPASLRNSIQHRSIYGQLLVLAELLGCTADGQVLLSQIDTILAGDASYKRGLTHPMLPS